MSRGEWAGITIGSCGLALSLYNTWRQRQADRPRMRVDVRRAAKSTDLPSGIEERIAEGEHWLEVRLANIGHPTVVLNGIGFLTSTRRPLDMSRWERSLARGEWPARFSTLAPGRAASIYVEERFVIESLQQVGQRGPTRVLACCWDQLGNRYQSEPITVPG